MRILVYVVFAAVWPLVLFAQVPPGAPTDGSGTYIIWDGFSSPGTEKEFRLSKEGDIVGYMRNTVDGEFATPVVGVSGSDTVAWIRGSERYIDYDVRKPFSRIDSLDTVSYAPFWLVTWGGMDTTHEDGEGWGIAGYTVEYSIGSPDGPWRTWFSDVDFTTAMFGPEEPVAVQESVKYYFRVKCYDYNTNYEDGHPTYDQWTQYLQPKLAFSVRNLEDSTDWTVRDTFQIGVDTVIHPHNSDVFIVKNRSIYYPIDIGVKGVKYAIPTRLDWELEDYPRMNKFGLRAVFNDNPYPPSHAYFMNPNNIVRDTFIVANDSIYGPGGYDIQPVTDPDSLRRTENLWLEVLLPTWSTTYGETTDVLFIMQFKAVPRVR